MDGQKGQDDYYRVPASQCRALISTQRVFYVFIDASIDFVIHFNRNRLQGQANWTSVSKSLMIILYVAAILK